MIPGLGATIGGLVATAAGGGGITGTTWNSADKHASLVLSGGDLIATLPSGGGGYRVVHAVSAKNSGKYIFDLIATGTIDGNMGYGLARVGSATNQAIGDGFFNAGSGGISGAGNFLGYGAGTGAPDPASGDTVTIAVDLDNDRIWYAVNGGNWNNDGSADPATNTNGKDCSAATSAGNCFPAWSCFSNGDACTANFSGPTFGKAVPAGFTAGWPA
jgi:hypothetical protein